MLTLDHLILRAADPAATLAELADRLGAPVLAPVAEVSGLASGIVRAGALDLEVLRVGATPPSQVSGYGLGFTADVPLPDASAALRSAGYPTSVPAKATADGRAGARCRSTGSSRTRSRCRRRPGSRASWTARPRPPRA